MSESGDARSSSRSELNRKDVEEMMSSLSNWGRWGENDTQGAMNLITPQKRKQAAELVTEGVSISLAHDAIKVRSDDSPPFEHKMIQTGETPNADSSADVFSVQFHGFNQTHLDALCHVFYQGKMYNGFSQAEVTSKGAAKLSVIEMKNGIFTRGVLMDLPTLWHEEYLEGARPISPEDLEAWERQAGLCIESGDAVFVRTGRWARRAAKGEWEIMQGSAGLHVSCLPWIKKRDIAILASDLAADLMPSRVEGILLPIHLGTIVAMGIPIIDNCDLENLSRAARSRKRWDFLLTAAPLAVEGGTGSPINPTATF
jgi:kynurenine formamidase